ncbi:ATP-binding cassette domain-containing protein, partial [Pseudomonas aeruginosa]|uniref:ATP-binding cassette domain-containing protein n=1 Tax=Pseudomonas aeruginosa TaxID=287 RepID=UPI002F3EDE50
MSDPAEVPTASPLLETVGLACERDWRMLFERLDLRLAAGELLQALGPTGSGNTTLLRLLSGLFQPTAGEVSLNGRPLADQRGVLAR